MSGKGQGKALQQALENWKKNQAKNQAQAVKLAEEKVKARCSLILCKLLPHGERPFYFGSQ